MMSVRVDPQAVVLAALREHADELHAFVGARVGAAEADDILQVAAMRALDRADTLNDPSRVRAWLFRIHRNLVTDTLRAEARRHRLHEGVAAEAESVSPTPERCDCSTVQARQLRPSYAAVLELVDVRGASVAEAAEELGISTNNVAVRLHRARKALRVALREHCGTESVADCLDCRCVPDGCCVA